MILTKEQINRYMRHIIMPEISGPGQKKITESTVYVYAENVKDVFSLILYLSASGVGRIFCYFDNKDDYEMLFHDAEDLNNDIVIKLKNKKLVNEGEHLKNAGNYESVIRIFLGSFEFIEKSITTVIDNENKNTFVSTILAGTNKWRGILQTFDSFGALNEFAEKISNKKVFENINDNIFSTSLLGTLCTIEVIKIVLGIGELHKDLLYFDILSLEFLKIEFAKTNLYLNKVAENKYDDYSSIREKIHDLKVLIVGAGGLGSPVALALLKSGIQTIGLVDYDTVEISNLNRQILHSTSRIGQSKVESAKTFLKKVNPHINIITHNEKFTKENAMDIISNYDIIVDGLDNFPTRYLLNDACFFMKKPMIEAGVLRFTGLNTTIIPEEGHCYRCMMPEMPEQGSIPSCEESGVLGPVPGVMGAIQAAEVVKLASGVGDTLKDKIIYFEALDLNFSVLNLEKNINCPLCGNNPTINILQEYEYNCDSTT
ncbi:MAG: HesA/MoeB/ThiF family protein [Bacillota bacterium]|nr:HesA/MoeB/ThiF family protein [Bacillota bacterium]